MEQKSKPLQIHLNNTPTDVFDIILKIKHKREVECRCSKSLEQTIYWIIREYKKQNQEIFNL